MNQHPPRPTTLVATSIQDLAAIAPVLIGFDTEDSVVMMTLKGQQPFHARVDLPDHIGPAEVGELLRSLHEPAVANRASTVAFLLYTDRLDFPVHVLAHSFEALFPNTGMDVLAIARVHDGHVYPWLGDRFAGIGRSYERRSRDLRSDMTGKGVVVHPSREHLAATARPVPELVALTEAAEAAEPIAPDAFDQLLSRGLPDDDAEAAETACALIEWSARLEPRRYVLSVLSVLSSGSARSHVALWTQVVRRCPDASLAHPSVLLAASAWVAGDGALAWVALDQCPAAIQTALGADLHTSLLNATPPPKWLASARERGLA